MITYILIAVIQGIGEFLPISSSGHLALFMLLTKWKEPALFFEILLHFATLGAVVIVYKKETIKLIKGGFKLLLKIFKPTLWKKDEEISQVLNVIIGTIPAVFVGLLIKDSIEKLNNMILALGFLFLLNAIILYSTKKINLNLNNGTIDYKKAFIIGIAQAFAILPGISRSGSTITTALWLKVNPKDAGTFSFLLSIPAILGATILEFATINISSINWTAYSLSILISFIVGFISLKFLIKLINKGAIWKFSFYLLPLGLLIIILYFSGIFNKL